MSIRRKIIIALLALSILPLSILGFMLYNNGRQAFEQSMIDKLTITNELQKDNFERWLAANVRSLKELARRPFLLDTLSELIEEHDVEDAEHMSEHEKLREDHLFALIEERGMFTEIFILNINDGLVLLSTNETEEGKFRESEPYFINGQDDSYIQNVYYSFPYMKEMMTIATPIKDRKGRLLAVLAGHLDLSELTQIMASSRYRTESEETYLINNNHFFVTESRFEAGYELSQTVHTQGAADCLNHKSGNGMFDDYRGVPVMGVYQWLSEYELCIITEIDQTEAFSKVILYRNVLIGISLIITVISAVSGIVIARSISEPIKHLVKGAEIIASGNLDYKVKIDNNDEIGDLTRSFNTMTAKLRKTEKKLKDYLANLEELVEQRTKKLSDAQEKLIRSEKLAMLGQLSGGVGHELRNPLGVISNAIYFLKTIIPDANETVNEYLEIISSEVHVAEKIVSDLLDFSRTKPLEAERTDVAEIIAQALKKHPAPENIKVIQKLAPDLPPVYVDPQQIHQVLTNLVTNAYDAMPEGGKLTINAKAKKSQVYLDITDTGSGISKKNMDNLFEPLFTTKARGIGLGLAVSKNLVESNGGSIKVKSKEGQGSTFTVILPTKEVVL